MKIKHLILIPKSQNTYEFLLAFIYQNSYELHAIYHTFDDLSGSVILEVSKYCDPMIVCQ